MDVQFNLGQEILDAVRKGGSEKWAPHRRDKKDVVNQISFNQRTQKQAEQAIQELFTDMGDRKWTVSQLAMTTQVNRYTVTKRLYILLERGRIKRSIAKQPHIYWRC